MRNKIQYRRDEKTHFIEEDLDCQVTDEIEKALWILKEDMDLPTEEVVRAVESRNKIQNKNRAPTIAFTSNKNSSKVLSNHLVKNGIATRNDNFYAWRCLKALNIDTNDGVVRTSLVHYNTEEDVNRLIEALKKIIKVLESKR